MKIHQNPTSFQPVTIALESKDELALFVHLIGAVPFSVSKKFNLNHDTVYDWYESLDGLLDISGEYPMLSIAEVPNVIHQESKDTEVDWSKVPAGTLIEVRNHPSDYWVTVEFHQYISYMHFPFESYTGPDTLWKYARLIKE